jgi:predicted RNA binding protein YcfA (HicA-like mRNA interferase family)
MRARDVEAILVRAGFVLDRQTGHRLWCKGERCLPVPTHTRVLKIGTVWSIIEQAGLTVDEFLELRR